MALNYYVDNVDGNDNQAVGSEVAPFGTMRCALSQTPDGDQQAHIWVKKTTRNYNFFSVQTSFTVTLDISLKRLWWSGTPTPLASWVGLRMFPTGGTHNFGTDKGWSITDYGVADTNYFYRNWIEIDCSAAATASGMTIAISDQGSDGLSLDFDGSMAYNKWVEVEGYNTTIGDMSNRGAYWQEVHDAYINGIDADCIIECDFTGNGSSNWLYETSYTDNMIFRNFYVSNIENEPICVTSGDNFVFERCYFSSSHDNVYYDGMDRITFIECIIISSDTGTPMTAYDLCFSYGCIFEGLNTTHVVLVNDNGLHCSVNDTYVGGEQAHVSINVGTTFMVNGTTYNSTERAGVVYNSSVEIYLNTIFMPDEDSVQAAFTCLGGGGGSMLPINCCIWGSGGGAVVPLYYNTHLTPRESDNGTKPYLLEENPDFVDVTEGATGNNYRVKNGNLLQKGFSNMALGAVRQGYKFIKRSIQGNRGRTKTVR